MYKYCLWVGMIWGGRGVNVEKIRLEKRFKQFLSSPKTFGAVNIYNNNMPTENVSCTLFYHHRRIFIPPVHIALIYTTHTHSIYSYIRKRECMYLGDAPAPNGNYVYSRSVRPPSSSPTSPGKKKGLRAYIYLYTTMVGRVIPSFSPPPRHLIATSFSLLRPIPIYNFLPYPSRPFSPLPPESLFHSLTLSYPPLSIFHSRPLPRVPLAFCFSFSYSLSPLTAVILPDTASLYTHTNIVSFTINTHTHIILYLLPTHSTIHVYIIMYIILCI